MITIVDATGTITITSAVDIVQSPEKEKITVVAFGTTVQVFWDETHYVSDSYTNYTIGGIIYGSAALAAAAIAAMLNTGANTSNNVKTVAYTVGTFDVSGCDYNFAKPANTTQQSIQLGAAAIVPANSPITEIVAKTVVGVTIGTATASIGLSSGTDEYISNVQLGGTNNIVSASAQITPSVSASSVYFSITPDILWSSPLMKNGKWKIYITYNDNSNL